MNEEKKPQTSDVKKAIDAAKLADTKERQKKDAELSRAVGVAFKNKTPISQGSGRR
jgi:hypothetical protein